MSKFQIITLAIFIVCIIAGATAFALYRGSSGTSQLPTITVWGTFPTDTFNKYLSAVNRTQAQQIAINYVEKTADDFSSDFVNALAIGQGPDAVLLSADLILPQANKLLLIPYSDTLSQRIFMESYIQEANIYLLDGGVLAIPFSIDPLVMYWNRDIYNAAGLATYPRYWDEFAGTSLNPGLVQKLTSKDENGNIRKTAVAMGDFANISNARELLGSLMLQSGNPVTISDASGNVSSAIGSSASASIVPALEFFTQFADPSDANYSWNRGMPNDKTAFLSGKLATYFGFASELSDLRAKNPNINFDISSLPQLRKGGMKAAYADIYGFSLVRASANSNIAYQVISLLTSPQYLAELSNITYLPSIRNDIIAQGTNDPYLTIFNQAALISRTWLDVNPTLSRQIFGTLVQSITSGKKTVIQAVNEAKNQYDAVLRQAI